MLLIQLLLLSKIQVFIKNILVCLFAVVVCINENGCSLQLNTYTFHIVSIFCLFVLFQCQIPLVCVRVPFYLFVKWACVFQWSPANLGFSRYWTELSVGGVKPACDFWPLKMKENICGKETTAHAWPPKHTHP